MYASYTAASFARKHDLADKHGVNFEGALTWAFEFEDQPFFAGFRSLASNGIDKPVLNVFRLFSLMGGERIEAQSSGAVDLDTMLRAGVRDQADINALASRSNSAVAVMVWNYHDDDLPAPPAEIDLSIEGLPAGRVRLHHYRVDADHSNAYEAWKKLGSPPDPSPEQYAQLEKAGQLQWLNPPERLRTANGRVALRFNLPRQGVSLLKLSW
jgi:xylan 1,4-beta-xylosidase